jgi:hypothetical protein
MKRLALFFSCTAAVLMLFCDNPSSNDDCAALPAGTAIKITSPAGGENYTVGQTVRIDFEVDNTLVSSADIKVTLDNGMNYKEVLSSGSIAVPGGSRYQCMSYEWTIGHEGEPVTWAAVDTCVLVVHQYGDQNINGQSQQFVVKQ